MNVSSETPNEALEPVPQHPARAMPDQLFWPSLAAVLLASALLKLWLLTRAVGFEQGDPLEYINIAHTLAHRTGMEWWDIRPLLFPILLVPLVYLGDSLGDVTGERAVQLLRLAPLVFSIAAIALSAGIAASLAGRTAALGTAIVVAANPTFNGLSVSPFAEIPATAGVLAATLLTLRGGRSFGIGLATGLALGLACMARYQSLAFIVPFGLWMVWARRGRPLTGFVFGLAGCAGAQAVLDLLAYGAPYHSLVQSAAYNVTSDEAARFYGAEPAHWYLLTIGEWFGFPALALALTGTVLALGRSTRQASLLVLLLGLVMLLWLSAIAHKELRFTSQVVPMLAIMAGVGIGGVRHQRRLWSGVLAATALVLVAVPGLWTTIKLDLVHNPGFVSGVKRVAEQQPGAVVGTIPWFIAAPYAHGRVTLVRADVDKWSDPAYMSDVIERADYLLLREYDFLADRSIERLVNARFRTIETYPEQVVLLQSRRLAEPARRGR